jgi:hypothetical protein
MMTEDNIVDFAMRRRSRAQDGSPRTPQQNLSRVTEADALLRALRGTKRLAKANQVVLVSNLGRLIDQLDARNRRSIAMSILQPNEWEKRKRYIQYPDEPASPSGRQAGSGGSFARIIERLIDMRVSGGVESDQAKSETVRRALKGTSFIRPSPFQMPDAIDAQDAAQFVADMTKVCDRLAQETDLSEFLALISKHQIFPDRGWPVWSNSLEIIPHHDPNHLYEWGWDSDEDDFAEWIPWWAPKCVVGHLYIRFQCARLNVPELDAAEMIKSIKDDDRRYSADYYFLIEPFIKPELMTRSRLYHRLPIWLIVLPLPNKIVPCLYIATHLPGGFYPNQEYPADDDAVVPCFVDKLGDRLSEDCVYFPDSFYDEGWASLYVHISDTSVTAIGSQIDEDIASFKCDPYFLTLPEDVPEWLRRHPVQRFLQLTMDSDAAKLFALSPRSFWGKKWESDDETIFRPAFTESVHLQITGLRHATIAAYLLRTMVAEEGQTIFDALKADAIIKHSAARKLLDSEAARFREAFNQRFEAK